MNMEFFINYPSDNALSRMVAEKIIEQILKGELKPGDKIVESTYAELFNISRSPSEKRFICSLQKD